MHKEAIVQQFFSLFNSRCLDAISQLLAPKAHIVFLPWGEGGVGEVEVLGKVVWESMIKSSLICKRR